ncbi:general substrate transporter [Lipomyces tetrasporus]|uniref:Quinate transporter n=1 Tax=Lipomyces tetrasporus TaxID=54092 RepID=A0AAD7VPM2_9ASCO|nr:general substrate transporter [Lipomyces tetrasporus]KAJ8096941.1 general substrate transporter [Lipomyces tetrasporus]
MTWKIRAFSKAEDRPTPKAVYNWRVYYTSLIVAIAGMTIGYDNGFVGGTLVLASFKAEFGLDKLPTTEFNVVTANIVSTFQVGCFFGALLVYPFGHLYGLRRGLMWSAGVFVLGCVFCVLPGVANGLAVLYVGRVLTGLGVGATSNLGPIYISEIAPPAIRGQLLAMYDVLWQIGSLVGFWINYAVNRTVPYGQSQWLIPFSLQFIPGGLLFIGTFFIRDSPRWLMMNGDMQKGLETLRWFRKLDETDEYLRFEIAQIEEAIESRAGAVGLGVWGPVKAVCRSPRIIKRLIFTTSLFIWQNSSGINAVNYYSPTIFKSLGIGGTNSSLLSTGIFGVLKTTGTFLWMVFLVETTGRRLTLMIGSAGVSLCMYFLGAYVKIANPTSHNSSGDLDSGGRAAMAFFYIWTVFYSASWNWTPWVINAEIFDQHVRTFVQAINAAANWFWSFIMARFTPQMFANMGAGGYGVYFMFASLSTVGLIYVFLLVPETKGIPLEMVDSLFTKGVPAWRAHAYVLSQESELQKEFVDLPEEKAAIENLEHADNADDADDDDQRRQEK